MVFVVKYVHLRRTPHGVRELKHQACDEAPGAVGRTPHGVRELKLLLG